MNLVLRLSLHLGLHYWKQFASVAGGTLYSALGGLLSLLQYVKARFGKFLSFLLGGMKAKLSAVSNVKEELHYFRAFC